MMFETKDEALNWAAERDRILLYPKVSKDGQFPTAGEVTGSDEEGWTTASCREYIESNPPFLAKCSEDFLARMEMADDSLLPAHAQPLADRRAEEAVKIQEEKDALAAMDDEELLAFLEAPVPPPPTPEPVPESLSEVRERFPHEDEETLLRRAWGVDNARASRERLRQEEEDYREYRAQKKEEEALLMEKERALTLPAPPPEEEEEEVTRPSSTPPEALEPAD